MRSFRRLLFSTLFFLSINSFAQEQTATQLSFAGVGGVLPSSIDGVSYNPAVLSLEADVLFGGGYGQQEVLNTDSRSYAGWIKDSMSSAFQTRANSKRRRKVKGSEGFPVSASLFYKDFKTSKNQDMKFRKYQLALATVFKRRWSGGLTFDHVSGRQQTLNQSYKYWSGSLGVLYWLSPKVKFGLSGRDLFEVGAKNKPAYQALVPKVRGSASYKVVSFFSVYADLEKELEDSKDLNYGLGLETKAKKYLTLRLGAFKNSALNNFDYGFGLSFRGPKLQLHYGGKFNSKSKLAVHSVDFTLPLW